MVGAALSIKLRCASWQQLATIYRRDLSRGSMFLKAATQPAIGTLVRIDLELPSATVIELSGVITNHVTDPQRGTGVDLKLEPLPTKSVWLIESALAAENKMRAQSSGAIPVSNQSGPIASIAEGEDVAAAEAELSRALEAEAESLRKLNPFLVLGVGYETTDAAVRAAFGELTKRYHPDRFARYQSERLRQIAAEIFILIRDAYRKLADETSRTQAAAAVGKQLPARAPAGQQQQRVRTPAGGVPRIAVPPVPTKIEPPTKSGANDAPTRPGPGAHDAPTNPSRATSELAHTELARADQVARTPQTPARSQTPLRGVPTVAIPPAFNEKKPMTSPLPVVADSTDAAAIDALLDEG
ncbi:MAG: heat shock protein DnaJ domain protein, partial [Myxococcales bacterium]|nr:heat shock protein DnaJ domain protein [Myxococcales bacterium]